MVCRRSCNLSMKLMSPGLAGHMGRLPPLYFVVLRIPEQRKQVHSTWIPPGMSVQDVFFFAADVEHDPCATDRGVSLHVVAL